MVHALDLGLADGAQHGGFLCLAKTAFPRAVGAVNECYVSAEVERLLSHEAAKRSYAKVMQTPHELLACIRQRLLLNLGYGRQQMVDGDGC